MIGILFSDTSCVIDLVIGFSTNRISKHQKKWDFSLGVNLAYVDTVDPVTHSTERAVTGDVIEKHHLRTNISLLVDS